MGRYQYKRNSPAFHSAYSLLYWDLGMAKEEEGEKCGGTNGRN